MVCVILRGRDGIGNFTLKLVDVTWKLSPDVQSLVFFDVDKETDRQTDRHIHRQTDRQTH